MKPEWDIRKLSEAYKAFIAEVESLPDYVEFGLRYEDLKYVRARYSISFDTGVQSRLIEFYSSPRYSVFWLDVRSEDFPIEFLVEINRSIFGSNAFVSPIHVLHKLIKLVAEYFTPIACINISFALLREEEGLQGQKEVVNCDLAELVTKGESNE